MEMCVMSPVHFDDEFSFGAKEIDDIWPKRRLPPESHAIKLAVTNDLPQFELGWRQALAHHSPKTLVLLVGFPDAAFSFPDVVTPPRKSRSLRARDLSALPQGEGWRRVCRHGHTPVALGS